MSLGWCNFSHYMAEIFDLPRIGFEQNNGIDRILWRIVLVSHGMLSLSPALGSGACRVGINPLVFPCPDGSALPVGCGH
jgi:hypothetical protein